MPLVAKVTTPHPLRGSSPRRGAFCSYHHHYPIRYYRHIRYIRHIRYGYWMANMTKRTIVTNMTNITVILH